MAFGAADGDHVAVGAVADRRLTEQFPLRRRNTRVVLAQARNWPTPASSPTIRVRRHRTSRVDCLCCQAPRLALAPCAPISARHNFVSDELSVDAISPRSIRFSARNGIGDRHLNGPVTSEQAMFRQRPTVQVPVSHQCLTPTAKRRRARRRRRPIAVGGCRRGHPRQRCRAP